MNRATKIVATLGPASDSPDMLQAILQAGADVLRLNCSHGHLQAHLQRVENVRRLSKQLNVEVALMLDLQGPKIRIGRFKDERVFLNKGQTFILDALCELGDESSVGLDYKDLPKDVSEGDVLLLDDGLIVLQVTQVKAHQIETIVLTGGLLSDHKGINRQGGGVSAPALTEKDMHDIRFGIEMAVDYIAISFPKSAEDVALARRIILDVAQEKNQLPPKIIAKIERFEAIAVLPEIIAASDGIMVARGDLAVEVGNAAVPALQKKMIALARQANKLTITATQMMESMVQSPIPTRAEVSDVANAVLDGTDAVMLSAETAVGRFPVETIQSMAAICLEAEKSQEVQLDKDFMHRTFTHVDEAVAMGALFTAFHLKAKAIISLTESGSTALWISRHDVQVPIFALTPSLIAERQMKLFKNVTPLPVSFHHDRDLALQQAIDILLARELIALGDVVILTVGEPMGQAGGTNMLKIVRVTHSVENDV